MPDHVRAELPDHEWAGTDDGHNCTGCDDTSIWKCDRLAHLPIRRPSDLLTYEERQQLHADLAEMSKQRRLAEGSAGCIPMA